MSLQLSLCYENEVLLKKFRFREQEGKFTHFLKKCVTSVANSGRKMASVKIISDANRLRYVRALERFHKSIIGYLSNSGDGKKEDYDKKVDSNLKIFYRVQEAPLYKGDLQDLHKLIKKIIELRNGDKPFEDIKEQILYASNQLEKTKNSRRYKKDKHSHSKYQEWE